MPFENKLISIVLLDAMIFQLLTCYRFLTRRVNFKLIVFTKLSELSSISKTVLLGNVEYQASKAIHNTLWGGVYLIFTLLSTLIGRFQILTKSNHIYSSRPNVLFGFKFSGYSGLVFFLINFKLFELKRKLVVVTFNSTHICLYLLNFTNERN